MRKLWLGVLLGLALPLAARAGEPPASGDLVVSVSLPVRGDPITEVARALEEEAAALGVKLDVTYAMWSPDVQLGQLERLVDRRVQAILLCPVPRGAKGESVDLRPVLDAAVAARIPVAVVGDRVATRKPLLQVHADQRQGGLAAAELVMERLGNAGEVLVLEGPAGAGLNEEYVSALVDRLKASKVHVLARVPAGFERHSGKGIVASLLAGHAKLDAVVAANDALALGAYDALREAGVDPATKVIVGWDGIAEARRRVQEGKLTATFDWDGAEQGRQALRALVQYLREGKEPQSSDLTVRPKLITKGPQG